jgi:soluble lytic murein transglycosylase
MMTLFCSDRITLDRWRKSAGPVLTLLLAFALPLCSQTLENLVGAYRASPSAARRQALLNYASSHPKDSNGALALLAAGATEVEHGDFASGVNHLGAAGSRLPQLADYAAFYAAQGRLGLKDPEAALRDLRAVLNHSPVSPLLGRAALLASNAYIQSQVPSSAVSILKENYPRLPQPDGDLALGLALEAAGELAPSAAYGQRVYYGYPATRQAGDAGALLDRLSAKLGSEYPPPTAAAMLERAAKWLEAGNFSRARTEYRALTLQLGGASREMAQVRIGGVSYRAGEARTARVYLEALSPSSPEADAERLYYLVQCSRSLDDAAAMSGFLDRLKGLYPSSDWRFIALVWAGNYYLLQNDAASYVPIYRAAYESFPKSPQADYCQWRVAWAAYIQRRGEAADLLREHITRFPDSDKVPAALYFLGRLSEAADDLAQARAHYGQILERYPNNYYAALASLRLSGRSLPAVAPSSARLDFNPNPSNQTRIIRSRLLESAGLAGWADSELRFAAREDGQPHVLATELARQAEARGASDQALRYIKAVFAGYLSTPLDAAPLEMWRLAFPLPFLPQLERYSKTRQIDLYLLAGLIRQESEFNPKAISRVGAIGLTQVMPSTGRQLSRTLKLGAFRNSLLQQADYNLRLGTFYFRSLMDQLDGSQEAVLAAYNAGKARADGWKTWASYREPAEFVENIPFTETRTYVQAVLRNAWMYRRIYGKE